MAAENPSAVVSARHHAPAADRWRVELGAFGP